MRIKLSLPLSLFEICSILDTARPEEDATVDYITFDSRTAQSGDLFIALRGSKYNGADFSEEALAKKSYVIAEWGNNITMKVSDAKTALLQLTKYYKSKLPNLKHTVAITGSVGKTTTKEFAAALLSQKYIVHATAKNQNNFIGAAFTVFSAPAETEILILEIGMNHLGEISEISGTVNPDIAVITNIGNAHIGNLKSRSNIAKAKTEITDGMMNGTVLVPFDEPLLSGISKRMTVSLTDGQANFFLIPLAINETGSIFDFYSSKKIFLSKRLNVIGKHHLHCFAYALSVAVLLGMDDAELTSALKHIDSTLLRQKRIQIGLYDIFDDTYSSSPEAVIETMKMLTIYKSIRKSAVLGDMLELGDKSEEMHYKIGKCATECGFNRLYLYGKFSSYTAHGAESSGMNKNRIHINSDISAPEITVSQIKATYNGELMIIKGSHDLHMEKIITLLSE
ncbi:MAG: UDP-N-acetylmuramoyl-tripeptide--D-alanyl-D-alanine ligase [Clostridia bacterium]|nr:UDP-N-acetylmuramoyl-tripeptide--D-alanyl-D-alanine ligase [Clostridia bacterium]